MRKEKDTMKKNEKIFQQDLSQKESPGYVFMMLLLMKEVCAMPDKQQMMSVMQAHLGDVECFTYSDDAAGFAPNNYQVVFEQAKRIL